MPVRLSTTVTKIALLPNCTVIGINCFITRLPYMIISACRPNFYESMENFLNSNSGLAVGNTKLEQII